MKRKFEAQNKEIYAVKMALPGLMYASETWIVQEQMKDD
jgi:hypothetical protein